ncbi:hypothetical protein SFR_6801 [Streptomyces sp. FR-008]|nr:hypothetical protein SFR_6801 [Streptomyces sp. FR-008]
MTERLQPRGGDHHRPVSGSPQWVPDAVEPGAETVSGAADERS